MYSVMARSGAIATPAPFSTIGSAIRWAEQTFGSVDVVARHNLSWNVVQGEKVVAWIDYEK